MGIDPWIFAAQIVNFLVLFVALRRWAFGPLGAAIDERRRHLAEAHADAEQREEDARRALEQAREERAAAERERSEARTAIDDEMQARRSEALAALDADLEEEKHAWRIGIERDLRRSLDDLDATLARLVVDEVDHALDWLTAADLADAQAKAFTEHLRTVTDETWDRAWRGLHASSSGIVIRCAFDPPADVREAWAADVGSRLKQARDRVDGSDRWSSTSFAVTIVHDRSVRMGALLDVGGLLLGGTASDVAARLDEAIDHAIAALGHRDVHDHLGDRPADAR